MSLEFGYTGDKSGEGSATPTVNGEGSGVTDLGTGLIDNGEATDLDENGKPKVVAPKGNENDYGGGGEGSGVKPDDKPVGQVDDNQAVDLVEGSILEIGEIKYTVDAAGNVVDPNGSIFKEAKDVKDWIASFDTVDDGDKDVLSIATIQDTLGIEIVGDDDAPIEFENNPAGVKAYVEAVLESERDEVREETINTLYQKYPIIPDVLNYYIANGNSLEGFGEVQDRSNITIDDTNEAQQESIIRTAWKEQNRKGDVEGYITYLKSNGTLLPTAKEELTGLQEVDKQVKEDQAAKAKEVEDARVESINKYWTGVQEVIKSRTIAGYQIPETIIVEKNGTKTSATPTDFYNYIYQVGKDGQSSYHKDLAQETPESRRDDEILRAYIKFVGGSYSNLVGMAVNKEKVNHLKLTAKQRTANSVKITKPTGTPAKGANTDLGFK